MTPFVAGVFVGTLVTLFVFWAVTDDGPDPDTEDEE